MPIIERDFPVEELNKIAIKEGNVKKPIYQIHKWWARRLGSIFRSIILLTFLEEDHLKKLSSKQKTLVQNKGWDKKFKEIFWGKFNKNGTLIERGIFYKNTDLGKILGFTPIVLDPFMGGGTTVVEALRLGCKVIGIDINPVAWFITKKEIEPVNLEDLQREFEILEERVGEKIKNYYKTICSKCGEKVDVMYIFWVKKVPCINCKKSIPLFTSFRIASKKGTHTVFCPNCRKIFETKTDYRLKTKCPNCNFIFIPNKGYVEKGKYICPHCKQKHDILKTVQLQGKIPDMEMYAIEFYCEKDGRNYKEIDEFDRDLFKEVKREFDKKKNQLLGRLIPDQEIPDGFNTKQAKNYNYRYFWQLFNERQLLCLSILLGEILKIENQNIKEYILAAFSDFLHFNNMFAFYLIYMHRVAGIFALHAYYPTYQPLENNLWGAKVGVGSFRKYMEGKIKQKIYCIKPWEIYVINDKTVKLEIPNDKIESEVTEDFEKLKNSKVTLLTSRTSEDLSFINGMVDAVITDPPYYDNVHYSELANFFYVWLRLGLAKKYPTYFNSKLIPKSREIEVNETIGKGEEFFLTGLTKVWKECYKILKDSGVLIFTFHHKATKAWSSILNSLLDAGFSISSVYPIFSEVRGSAHIYGREARSFDTIVVARKRREGEKEERVWETLKDEIFLQAKEALNRIKKSHTELSNGDISTIVLGKCLEIYSKHYPNVSDSKGRSIKVEQAVKDIIDIIDSLKIEEYVPENIDPITSTYIQFLSTKRAIDFNELNKLLQPKGLSEKEFKEANILEPRGSSYRITPPKERGKIIEEKFKGRRFELKLYIDVIHYLYYIYKQYGRLPKTLWTFDIKIIRDVLNYLYKKTRDKTYKDLWDLLEGYKPQKVVTLERFI